MSSSQIESVMTQLVDAVTKIDKMHREGVIPLEYQKTIAGEVTILQGAAIQYYDQYVKGLIR